MKPFWSTALVGYRFESLKTNMFVLVSDGWLLDPDEDQPVGGLERPSE